MVQHTKVYSSAVEVLFVGSSHTIKRNYESLQLNRTMGIFNIDTTQPVVAMQVELFASDVSYDTFARIYRIDERPYTKFKFYDASDIFDFFVGAWYLRATSHHIIRTQFYANRHYFTPDAIKSPQLASALVGFGIDCESLRQLRLSTSTNKCDHTYCSIVSEYHEHLYMSICRIKETDN